MNHYDATYWKTMAQQEGNVKDSSNLYTLSIDFGLQVASIVYGLDMNFNYRGFHINGEYVVNSNHYMFPDDLPGTGMPSYVVDIQPPRQGHKWSENDHAYYITAKKDWQKYGFACELFKMGRFYRPYMDYYFPRVDAGAVNARNSTVRLPLIEDNDDDDSTPIPWLKCVLWAGRFFRSRIPTVCFRGTIPIMTVFRITTKTITACRIMMNRFLCSIPILMSLYSAMITIIIQFPTSGKTI